MCLVLRLLFTYILAYIRNLFSDVFIYYMHLCMLDILKLIYYLTIINKVVYLLLKVNEFLFLVIFHVVLVDDLFSEIY